MEVMLSNDILQQFPQVGAVGEALATLRIIKPGKNADGYWCNKDLVEQTKAAIILFNILLPGCTTVYI
jgi:hypothetical protein